MNFHLYILIHYIPLHYYEAIGQLSLKKRLKFKSLFTGKNKALHFDFCKMDPEKTTIQINQQQNIIL